MGDSPITKLHVYPDPASGAPAAEELLEGELVEELLDLGALDGALTLVLEAALDGALELVRALAADVELLLLEVTATVLEGIVLLVGPLLEGMLLLAGSLLDGATPDALLLVLVAPIVPEEGGTVAPPPADETPLVPWVAPPAPSEVVGVLVGIVEPALAGAPPRPGLPKPVIGIYEVPLLQPAAGSRRKRATSADGRASLAKVIGNPAITCPETAGMAHISRHEGRDGEARLTQNRQVAKTQNRGSRNRPLLGGTKARFRGDGAGFRHDRGAFGEDAASLPRNRGCLFKDRGWLRRNHDLLVTDRGGFATDRGRFRRGGRSLPRNRDVLASDRGYFAMSVARFRRGGLSLRRNRDVLGSDRGCFAMGRGRLRRGCGSLRRNRDVLVSDRGYFARRRGRLRRGRGSLRRNRGGLVSDRGYFARSCGSS